MHKKIISGLIIITLILTSLTGCSSEEEVQPLGEQKDVSIVSPSGESDTVGDTQESEQQQGSTLTDTQGEAVVHDPLPSADTSKEQQSTQDTTEGDPKDDTPAADTGKQPDSSDAIIQNWNNTFLVSLPVFTQGTLVGTEAQDTFDYITIGDITDASIVEKYVAQLKASGFDIAVDYSDRNLEINFTASNADAWTATVSYSRATGQVRIGCGFFDEESGSEGGYVWKDTLLSYLPEPEAGVITTSFSENEEGQFDYVVIEDITIDDIKLYVQKLEKAGYIYDVDTGEDTDLLWYIAYNEDSMICELEYALGVCTLGSGYTEIN